MEFHPEFNNLYARRAPDLRSGDSGPSLGATVVVRPGLCAVGAPNRFQFGTLSPGSSRKILGTEENYLVFRGGDGGKTIRKERPTELEFGQL